MKSILSKLWLGITSVVLIILLSIWLFQVVLLEKFYIEERTDLLLEEGEKISSLISVSNNNPIISQEVIDEINSFRASFSFNIIVAIMDSNNNILFSDAGRIPLTKDNLSPSQKEHHFFRDLHVNLSSNEVETFINQVDKGKRSMLAVKIPIMKEKRVIGNILITSALTPIQETTSILKKQLSMITWISILIATLLALLLAKLFIKPILKITEASKKISEGDFTVNVTLDSKDEIGVLGNTINNLAIQLGQIEKFRREFIANVSHELKTPISLIRAYAELVMDIDDDKETRNEHLQVIVDESNRLNNMVEDILYLSKMEAGYAELTYTQFPIIGLIHKVIEKLNFFASKKNIKLIVEIDEQNTYITADKDKIYQVFFNLINNAIQHSYENSQVAIKVTNITHGVRIEIIDYGKGISKEDLPYIWDRFYKVDKSRKRDISGTGLGMSIVKNILEAHNFHYGIESEIGKGTILWIETEKLDV